MTLLIQSQSGLADHTCTLYNRSTIEVVQVLTLVEKDSTGIYYATPSNLLAGDYLAVYSREGSMLGSGTYSWNGLKEITDKSISEQISSVSIDTTDLASEQSVSRVLTTIEGLATQTKLTEFRGVFESLLSDNKTKFSPVAVSNVPASSGGTTGGFLQSDRERLQKIPIDPLLSGNYVSPDNAVLNSFVNEFRALLNSNKTSFNSAALINIPTGLFGTAERQHLLGIPKNPALLPDINQSINTAKQSVIDVGNSLWKTNTTANSVAPDNTTIGNIFSTLNGLLNGNKDAFTSNALKFAPVGAGSGDGTGTGGGIFGPLHAEQLESIASLIANGAFKSSAFVNLNVNGSIDSSSIATQVRTVITPQLNEIRDAAKLAALPLSANLIQTDENAITKYVKDGVTELRQQTFNADGEASLTDVVKQVKVG